MKMDYNLQKGKVIKNIRNIDQKRIDNSAN